MSDVLGVHEEVNFPVHRDGHFRGHDVVLRVSVVVSVNAIEVLVSFAEHFRMNSAESSVRAGITEVKSELSCLHLDRYRVGGGRCEINIRPSLDSKDAQRQNLRAHEKKGGPDHGLGSAWKILYFFSGLGVGESPNEQRQDDLRGQERNS